MAQISASDVSKLRKSTGAGMMDCKKALEEANGDFDKAVDIIRKKGQAIANKRADREATEGAVLADVTSDEKRGAIVVLNCETDFVAKNDSFIELTKKILDKALNEKPSDLDALKNIDMEGRKINDIVVEQIGIIGEKLDLAYYDSLEAEKVVSYIHPGNKLATIVGFNKSDFDNQVAKDVAMQVAAMNPEAIDKDDVSEDIKQRELEIGKEQARNEGKPENIIEKIAMGKLNKFYKESTLLNQDFIKESKMTVRQYLESVDKELKVTGFKRYSLSV